jgi:signal transduction histidine kinase
VFIDAVEADQRYEEAAEVEIPSTVARITFEFHGISFKTRPEAMVYLYRLQGYEVDWKSTHERRVEYQDLSAGQYTFEVQAVDRDLSYSEQPAQVRVNVHLPYERIGWVSALSLAVTLILWQAGRITLRDRKLQVANRDLAQANQRLRETQTQLVQAEKLATVGLLAGGVAHEINNPLQAILQGAQRIRKYPEDTQRHQQSASLMEQAAQRCSAIVQSLLSYTRRSGGEFAPVDLNGVVDSTLALLRSHLGQAGIAVRVERGELPAVEGNFNELCTVLTNLAMNARDVLATEGRQGVVEITTAAVAGEVVLRVRDNGPGIPAELRQRIFDPFYTTKPVGSGTGLGLSIVQGIVQRHQGRIEVESEEGGGTIFIVSLPVQS